jgi:hypothetical protein
LLGDARLVELVLSRTLQKGTLTAQSVAFILAGVLTTPTSCQPKGMQHCAAEQWLLMMLRPGLTAAVITAKYNGWQIEQAAGAEGLWRLLAQ